MLLLQLRLYLFATLRRRRPALTSLQDLVGPGQRAVLEGALVGVDVLDELFVEPAQPRLVCAVLCEELFYLLLVRLVDVRMYQC